MYRKMITFSSGSLALEGQMIKPADSKGAGVVLCHPHPLYGGSMENNVINAVSRALSDKGISALCFNFRGVGRSEGSFDDGRGEIDDALAAVSCLIENQGIDGSRVGLMGYSFGGMVALEAAMRSDKVQVVAAVSPMAIPDLSPSLSRLVISGTNDSFVPVSGIMEEEEKIIDDGAGEVKIIKGADHFWWGMEASLAEVVSSFLEKHLLS